MKFREEVVNIFLAEVLRSHGLIANSEIIVSRKKMPDIRIIIWGLKVVLEGKIAKASKMLRRQAKARLEGGLADISIAIFYPEDLMEADGEEDLKNNIASSTFNGMIFYWSSEGIKENEFQSLSVPELASLLNRVLSLYIENDLLSKKIEEIDNLIKELTGEGQQTSLLFHTTVTEEKLQEVLGVGEENGEEEGE